MSVINFIGFAAGSLTTLSFVPQVMKTFRTKRCHDLSATMLASFTGGVSLWLVYGIFLQSSPIILANLVTLVLLLGIVVMKVAYGGREPLNQKTSDSWPLSGKPW